jgi:hypothetical protein
MSTNNRTAKLEIWLTPEELEMLERVADYEGAETLLAWARQKILACGRVVSKEMEKHRTPSGRHVINWRGADRRMADMFRDQEDMATPIKRVDTIRPKS